MILFLVALLILGPVAEIYVLLSAGGAFGVWPVIAACIGTAVLGGVLLRIQGFNALLSARRDLEAGKAPVEAAVDGVFLVVAAPMLLLPGFITDFAGFLLLVPPLRRAIARAALRRLRAGIERGEARIEFRRF